MKMIIGKILLSMLPVLFLFTTAVAQPPPPDHGEDDDQPAPIGSELGLLLLMGGAYGAKKVYDAKKRLAV